MKLINYQKAATFLDVPIGTLYAMVHEKRIPHIRLSKRMVRFDVEELEVWLRERRAGRDPAAVATSK